MADEQRQSLVHYDDVDGSYLEKRQLRRSGSLLPGLPRMTWALWQDKQHRAAKMHVQFEVLRGIPIHVDLTTGNGSETTAMKGRLKPG